MTPGEASARSGEAADTAWWHRALVEGELLVARCEACGRVRFPPMPSCPFCGHPGAGSPLCATGLGRVYSWVIVAMALDPAFADEVPYAIIAVDLDEGPRVFARFRGEHGSLGAGLRVRRIPATTSAGEVVLAFEPLRDEDDEAATE